MATNTKANTRVNRDKGKYFLSQGFHYPYHMTSGIFSQKRKKAKDVIADVVVVVRLKGASQVNLQTKVSSAGPCPCANVL